MDIKRGLILSALYAVPFWIIAGPPASDIGHAILIPIYVAISFILAGIVMVVGAKFFDLDIIPWGLIILASPLFAVPFTLIPGLWYVPAAVIFVIGLIGG
ncbi:hypothetical protein [Palaeococcus ferrophilus]|uniref:hypothetical protein n=1 Tax=Palaeococcus ferrophilus TaxID=83868 RepID=UPI00064EA992|nr:hypothetical protein [Palaeococcus ferrophilus]